MLEGAPRLDAEMQLEGLTKEDMIAHTKKPAGDVCDMADTPSYQRN